jgi:ketosteroid isomerase-like protein
MKKFFTVIIPLLVASTVFADERSAETERVVMRHLAASEAGDASVVPRDYAEDAVVIFGNEAKRGVAAIQKVFENLYARTEMRLTLTRTVFDGDVGYVVWTMDDLQGSDTFVVQNGKIVVQTGVVFRPPTEAAAP